MIIYKKLTTYISEHRLAAINLLLLMSAVALASLCWRLISIAKNIILIKFRVDINPWAVLFYHPQESALANYIGLCICLGCYGLCIYRQKTLHFVRSHSGVIAPFTLLVSTLLSLFLLILSAILTPLLSIVLLIIVFFLPLLYFIRPVVCAG
jgi:hypothetical protein